jgi:hypothetical protein
MGWILRSEVLGTEEVNLVGHNDVGGAKKMILVAVRGQRCAEGEKVAIPILGERYRASDTGLKTKVSKSDFRTSRC